jgi:asparagine synthase (glutamine-hydrolysing)
MIPSKWRPARLGHRARRGAELLSAGEDEVYLGLVSLWHQPDRIVVGAREPVSLMTSPAVRSLVPDFMSRMQYIDTLTYLPDDILTKVDRASMAVSLEARVPILDHRVVQFAWRLPTTMRVRDGQGKWILRRVLERFVPRHLFERPKMGFGVPIGDWLRGPLKDWARHLLSEEELKRRNLFDPAPIRRRWAAHLEKGENWQYPLWAILSLQAWLDRNS